MNFERSWILEEIGINEDERQSIKIKRIKSNPNKATSTRPSPIRVTFGDLLVDSNIRMEEVFKNKDFKIEQTFLLTKTWPWLKLLD